MRCVVSVDKYKTRGEQKRESGAERGARFA